MQNFKDGEIIQINKPLGWSSFDVVKKMRGILNRSHNFTYEKGETVPKYRIKIGHAGTLDPLATGLMIICTGKQTKNIDQLQAHNKEYTGTFFLGATTPGFDKELEADAHFPTGHITEELILEAAKKFIGTIQQIPPVFSAVKVNGKRSYKAARKGNMNAEPLPREITIHEFQITKIELPLVGFRVVCSKGTYIRSLARDFGKALNSGAHLEALCRTKIGEYELKNAVELTAFEAMLKDQSAAVIL
jgi:tRNA pseudouridine55 synthase